MKSFSTTLVALNALLLVSSTVESSRLLEDSAMYPDGTPVSFFEDDKWYDGVVEKYEGGIYTIKWDEDDELEEIEVGSEMDQLVDDGMGDDDAPPAGIVLSDGIAIGTPAFIWDDNQWFDGAITDHSNGEYTVVWSDGDTDTYKDEGDDLKELQQAIEDAMGDDDEITDDEIASLDNEEAATTDSDDAEDVIEASEDVSEVVSEDDSEDVYDDDAPYDDAVENTDDASEDVADDDAAFDDDASEDSEDSDAISVGTAVSIYDNDTWVDGQIIDHADGVYTVAWNQDTDNEYIDTYDDEGEDFEELKLAVDNSSGDDDAAPTDYEYVPPAWEIGTPVSVNEDDAEWYGYIADYFNGEYSIAWDDGESEWIDDIEIVAMLVADAKSSSEDMHISGQMLIGIGVGSVVLLAAVALYNRHKKGSSKSSRRRALPVPSGSAYKDRPGRGEASYYKKQEQNLRIV